MYSVLCSDHQTDFITVIKRGRGPAQAASLHHLCQGDGAPLHNCTAYAHFGVYSALRKLPTIVCDI